MDKKEKMDALAKLWHGRPDISKIEIIKNKEGKGFTLDFGDDNKFSFFISGKTDIAGIKINGDIDFDKIHSSQDRLTGKEISNLFFGDQPGLAVKSVEAFALKVAQEIDMSLAETLPFNKLVEQEKNRLKTFKDNLFVDTDQDIVNILVTTKQSHDKSIYEWFTDENAPNLEYRKQAINLWPMFAKEMSTLKILKDAIDNGEPIISAFQNSIASGINKAVLNRLKGTFVDPGKLSTRMLLEILNTFQVDWIPQNNPKEMQILTDIINIVTPLTGECEFNEATLLRESKGRWKEFRDKIAKEIVIKRAPENAEEETMKRLSSIAEHLKNVKQKTSIGFVNGLIDIISEKIEAETDNRINKTHISGWLIAEVSPEITPDNMIYQANIEIVGMILEFVDQVVIPAAIKKIPLNMEVNLSGSDGHKIFIETAKSLFGDKAWLAQLEALNSYRSIIQIKKSEILNSNLQLDEEEVTKIVQKNNVGHNTNLKLKFGLLVPKSKIEWPALTDVVQAPNGLWITPLTNDRLLYFEGSHGRDHLGALGLSHCCSWMNSYNSNKCFRNKHHILSVRKFVNGKYFRIGTVEYCPVSETKPYSLSRYQFSYFGNGTPPPDAMEALRWYEDAVSSGEVLINDEIFIKNNLNHEMFIDQDGNLDPVRSAFIRAARYDWLEGSSFEKMYEAWTPIMPKAWRKAGVEGFMNLDNVKNARLMAAPATVSVDRMIKAMPRLTF